MGSKKEKNLTANTLRLAVVIPTFRRPELLEKLLSHLAEQHLPGIDEVGVELSLKVFVADNDADKQEGMSIVSRLAGTFTFPISARLVEKTGVSHTRNILIAEALQWNACFVLMIDDDEWPGPDWIASMIKCAITYNAGIVSGPVRPDYETTPPEWISHYQLFDDAPGSTGQPATVQRTGNTLFNTDVLINNALFQDKEWFSVSLGRVGGEDSHLVERLVDTGVRNMWCEEAEVFEWVPSSRLTLSYLCARAFRSGNSGMLYRSMLHPGVAWSSVRVGKTAFLFIRWLLLSYRYLFEYSRPFHHLEIHTVAGRLNAHFGRYKHFY